MIHYCFHSTDNNNTGYSQKNRCMKNLYLVIGFVFAVLIYSTEKTAAQYIVTGKHNPGNHYIDITPDTTLTGPNNHPPDNLPPTAYSIDINGDNVADFSLYAIGYWENNMGDSKICIKRLDQQKWQIALGHSDTCHELWPYSELFNMAKSLKFNDTIDGKLSWSYGNYDAELFLTYTNWLTTHFNCKYNAFVNDSMENYIGVRLLDSFDTIYGWIKITDVHFLSFTVQEFAFGSNSTGMEDLQCDIKIFSNPSDGKITIQTLLSDVDLTVYNILGVEILPKMPIENRTYIDLCEKATGIYIFKFHRNNSIMIKKIVKQ